MPRVTFLPDGKSAEVPAGTSILDAAEAADVDLPHNCGGVAACTTCHVWIEQGLASLSELGDREDDKLNEAAGLAPSSRLGCQACVGGEDVVVRIPGNRIAS
ncbi:ferredoxin [Anaeromyxobacter dehalogenans 2CP-1]|uniref:Ferredoxin n=1 Tax=Anaeromyxobacter dehalogenans (strain ATCC BAA-258 / DSM 21875 / 2CP-1) TaxID=455488 RepID=B8JC58_ANAD2|nr:2Fe-2S iron-sulfur cluster-binding protein [Anaeromyxobacter dehalogenans]ACL63980.1 ferredoxin [Anaeromyxobacter dehalogenans 2CP-1]